MYLKRLEMYYPIATQRFYWVQVQTTQLKI
jgi:hypothetical protein